MNKIFKLGIAKNFIVHYVDLVSILWLLLDKWLATFHQLFSWTSVGPSKYPIDKIIPSQSDQFPDYHVY